MLIIAVLVVLCALADCVWGQTTGATGTGSSSNACSNQGWGRFPYHPDSAVPLSLTYPLGSGTGSTTTTLTTGLYGYEFQTSRCTGDWQTGNPQYSYWDSANSVTVSFTQCTSQSQRSQYQCQVGQQGQDGMACASGQSVCSGIAAFSSFCCLCPSGKYAQQGSTVNSAADCTACPIGSFMGQNLYGLQTALCLACPVGTYSDTTGSASCTACPAGKSTFTSNSYQTSGTGFTIGATSLAQCVSISNVDYPGGPPCPWLSHDTTSITYYAGSGDQYNYGFEYFSNCRKYGQLLSTSTRTNYPSGTADTDANCAVCPPNTPYFYAGGMNSVITSFFNPPGFSIAVNSYVYGTQIASSQGQADGGTVYTNYVSDIQTPTCLTECTAGTGAQSLSAAGGGGDGILTCTNCVSLLGQYNPSNGGSCSICPKDSYPASDRATSCHACPYPYISDWDSATARSSEQGMGQSGLSQQWLQNYAQNVLRYRSCERDAPNGQGRALCLCLPTARMLGIVLPITAFFITLIGFFIVFSIGTSSSSSSCCSSSNAVAQQQPAPAVATTTAIATAVEKDEPHFQVLPTSNPSGDTWDDADVVPPPKSPAGPEHTVDVDESNDPLGRLAHKPVLVGWRVTIGLLAYVLLPFADGMTDLAFLLSNPFYNVGLFVAMTLAYCAPALVFVKTLMDKKAAPRFYLVPIPDQLIFKAYDSLYKLLIGAIILVPFTILNSLALAPWLALGCLLYTTKAFAIRPVANLWLHVWTGTVFAEQGTPLWEQRRRDLELALWHPLDEVVLNESIMAHVVFETFPICAIQILNNQWTNSWNALAVASLAVSIFNAFSGLYRIMYFRLYLGIKFADIPVDFAIFGLSVFGSETTKTLLGEGGVGVGEDGAQKTHRFSISRSISGMHTNVTDEWIDAKGHVHHEDVKAPILQHVAQDLVQLTERVTRLEILTRAGVDGGADFIAVPAAAAAAAAGKQ